MEQEEFGMVNQEYDDGSGNNQGTTTTVDYGVHLPAYLGYLSLGFKVISFNSDHRTNGWLGNHHNQNYKEFTQGP